MKKFLVAIFAVFYLVISSGFTLHFHYCMGKPAGWGLFPLDKDKCGICGMHKRNSKGCCKDENKTVKLTFDQKVSDNNIVKIQQLAQVAPAPLVAEYSSALFQPDYRELNNLSPPHLRSVPVFIYNCNFRI
jgi:hypothetical protein